jgi:hypothetical protein
MNTKEVLKYELARSWDCLAVEAKTIKATMDRILVIAHTQGAINGVGELQATHSLNALCGKIAMLQKLLCDTEENK